jgi:hypothetical protein
MRRSQSSISRIIKQMNYTRKRLVKVPEERNTLKTIDLRQEYCNVINNIGDNNLVFLDETGVNLHHSRNYGYSPKNAKAVKVFKGNRGRNVSCLVAIKNTRIIAFELKEGAFNGEYFVEFIRNKLKFHFELNPYDILVMDNCSFHYKQSVINEFLINNITIRFLPPYSPQLNPIEEYFSHFKALWFRMVKE